MRISHRVGRSAAVAVALILLSGCAATSAAPHEAGSRTPTPTPTAPQQPAEIATLTLGGTSVTALDADGATLGSFEYTVDGPVAMAFLTDALGSEPVVSERPGDSSCTATASAAVWADGAVVLIFGFPEKTGLPDGQTVSVHATAKTVGGVELLTPTGAGVGDAVDTLVGALPGVGTHQHQSAPSMLLVDYDVVDGTYEDIDDADFGMTANAYWGAQAAATDGTITDLTAPTYFQSAC